MLITALICDKTRGLNLSAVLYHPSKSKSHGSFSLCCWHHGNNSHLLSLLVFRFHIFSRSPTEHMSMVQYRSSAAVYWSQLLYIYCTLRRAWHQCLPARCCVTLRRWSTAGGVVWCTRLGTPATASRRRVPGSRQLDTPTTRSCSPRRTSHSTALSPLTAPLSTSHTFTEYEYRYKSSQTSPHS